ncbi:MAG TPA: hypothetical protein PLC76_09870 [Saprospiraceae bacterium]|jgi:copper chaperone CopZ|nr:MAG: heavy metal transport/detoxification protein [Candidatus Parvibacillus calidus]MBX2937121.1 hypothetical protein [Saprospiraceae bacterium]MBK7741301.1 hypothetical protein [Candidatus Parvibacillus calidus]MBX7178578.1 hypothetical protein [Saprospiraceae bacterium]MCB0592182.1 hypothetical protein [Saprospiraceae bacterium]
MEDKNMKFKTNINCSGCIEKVTPFLDLSAGAGNWEVDTTNKDKILTVQGLDKSEAEIMDSVKRAGYRIEVLEAP